MDKEKDENLKLCNKSILLNIGSTNSSEYRIGTYFAAILAELTEGIYFDPQSGINYLGIEVLKHIPSMVNDYEKSIPTEKFHLYKFEEWN